MNIPEGWKLVPVEPTEEMMRNAMGTCWFPHLVWPAMLAAAPTPPVQTVTHRPDGSPRDPRDIASDPEGILIHDSNEPLYAATPAQENEPVLYAIFGPDGKPHFSESCVSGIKGDLGDDIYYLNEDRDGEPYREVPLYTRSDNSGLRKAAEEALEALETIIAVGSPFGYEKTAENLRAALEGK